MRRNNGSTLAPKHMRCCASGKLYGHSTVREGREVGCMSEEHNIRVQCLDSSQSMLGGHQCGEGSRDAAHVQGCLLGLCKDILSEGIMYRYVICADAQWDF